MTRILLPVLIGIVALYGLATITPIFIREVLGQLRRERELDDWAEDVRW